MLVSQCTVGFAHFAGTGLVAEMKLLLGPAGLLAVLIMLQPSEVPLQVTVQKREKVAC